MPAMVVNAMVARTLTATRARVAALSPRTDGWVRKRSMAGSTCHTPKRTADIVVAPRTPKPRANSPHSTLRNATSSNRTVPKGMTTRAVNKACLNPRRYRVSRNAARVKGIVTATQ